MVKINKVYTRSGDNGTTALGDGVRVPKASQRVEAYGAVDAANAALGVAVVVAQRGGTDDDRAIAEELLEAQQGLFDAGADLCTPAAKDEEQGSRLRVTHAQVQAIEAAIDAHNERLATLASFVLPGGTELAARLHVARTTVRAAEILVCRLVQHEGDMAVNPRCVAYLNRLSDLLFVLGRVANGRGQGDVLWVPGAQRRGRGGDGSRG